MLSVDFHTHSNFSPCGMHTCLEMIGYAEKAGLSGIAVSDHGCLVGGKVPTTFYERFSNPVNGIRFFKGIECNIADEQGGLDLPQGYTEFIDIVLAGIHSNTPTSQGEKHYTDALIKAAEKNPALDIIVHPNSLTYPVEYLPLCRAAKELDKVIELNNSKLRNNRVPRESAVQLIEAAGKSGCRIAVSSDAHCVNEIGTDTLVATIIQKSGFPKEQVVNLNPEEAFRFVESRRRNKRT
ncbi:MAG: PHP domain-containing protein [Chitinivibrionales bacterium]